MKNKKIMVFVFTVIHVIIFSLGVACFLGALGTMLGASLDHVNPWKEYPLFMPFCVIVGLVSFVLFIITLALNIRFIGKAELSNKVWIVEVLCTLVALIPMLYFWDMVFEILGKIF